MAFMGPSINCVFSITDTKPDLTVSLYFDFSTLHSCCLLTSSSLVFRWFPLVASLDTFSHSFSALICLAFAEFFSCFFLHVVMLFACVVCPQHCAHKLDLVASLKQVLMPCVVKCLKRLHASNLECSHLFSGQITKPSVDLLILLCCTVSFSPSFLASFIAALFQQC